MEEETKTGAQGPQGNPDVSEKQNPDRPASVEGDGSAPSDSGQSRAKEPDWKSKYFAQQRLLDKQAKRLDELDQWRQQFNQTPAQSQPVANPDDEQTKYWTNPIEYTKQVVKQSLAGDMKAEISRMQLAQDQVKAEEYILSQDYVDPEADAESFRTIMAEHGLAPAWAADPFKTAKAILKIFKAERGISEKKSPPKSQAGSVLSGSAPVANGNGKKFFTAREVRSMSLEEYEKNRDAIEAARKEGRIEVEKT